MTSQQWLGLVVKTSIMLTMFGFGLTTTRDQALYLFRNPPLLLRAVLSMSVLMPVVVAMLVRWAEVRFEVGVALVALAVSPVPPMIQKKQIAAGSRKEYVAGLLVAMASIAILTVPLSLAICNWLFDLHGEIGPLAVAKIVATTVLGPLAVGLLVRSVFPAAGRASGGVLTVATVLLVGSVPVLMVGLWPEVRGFIGNGMLVAMAIVALIGLAIGHMLGGPLPSDRTALAISTASRHPAVALALATSGAATETKPELAIILAYLVVATLVAIPYQKWREKRATATPEAPR